jgi:monooxygenase
MVSASNAAPLDVLIVGAGLSGIGAARHLQKLCPGKTFALLEARAALGGTWDLFRYPGIRSDSDMHTLGYSFKPWTAAKAIADGPSILNYIRSAAEETGVTQHIRYRHTVKRAAWSSQQALWTVDCEQQLDDGVQTVQIQARFLYLCSGYYSYAEGHAPEFAGQADFAGQVVHPQFWPEKLDYANKQVVVIGSGATAVTLVPSMADTAAHVTMLQRSPTYVISRPGEDGLAQRLQRLLPDRLAYALTRWKNVGLGMFFFQLSRRRPNRVKQILVHLAKKQAGGKVDAAHFTPKYKPWDQRVCVVPDGDLFRQLRAGKASVVTDTIDHFTPTGIKLNSGKEIKADIVVTATGLKLNALGDIAVTVDGKPCNANQTLVYRGMMLSDVPNLAMAFGYTNASWTLKADLTAERVCRLLNHMDAKGLRSAVARPGNDVQPQPFLDFSSGYVQRAADLLPKQGSRRPWQVYQNYLLDMLTIRYGRIADGVVQFSR